MSELYVCYCGTVAPRGPDFPHDDCDGGRKLTKSEAAQLFKGLLVSCGAGLEPRDPRWLDYSEPKNVFTADYR